MRGARRTSLVRRSAARARQRRRWAFFSSLSVTRHPHKLVEIDAPVTLLVDQQYLHGFVS